MLHNVVLLASELGKRYFFSLLLGVQLSPLGAWRSCCFEKSFPRPGLGKQFDQTHEHCTRVKEQDIPRHVEAMREVQI